MLRWLWDRIVGSLCRHKFRLIEHATVTDESGRKIGKFYHMQCEKCGDVVKRSHFA